MRESVKRTREQASSAKESAACTQTQRKWSERATAAKKAKSKLSLHASMNDWTLTLTLTLASTSTSA